MVGWARAEVVKVARPRAMSAQIHKLVRIPRIRLFTVLFTLRRPDVKTPVPVQTGQSRDKVHLSCVGLYNRKRVHLPSKKFSKRRKFARLTRQNGKNG